MKRELSSLSFDFDRIAPQGTLDRITKGRDPTLLLEPLEARRGGKPDGTTRHCQFVSGVRKPGRLPIDRRMPSRPTLESMTWVGFLESANAGTPWVCATRLKSWSGIACDRQYV